MACIAAILLPHSLMAATYKGEINIEVGEQFFVDVSYGNYVTQSGYWSKSNSTFRFISQGPRSCTIEGLHVGTGTLSYWGLVNADEVEFYWTVNVFPKQVLVTNITINQSSLSLNVGDSYQLSATVLPSDATDKSVSWTSSNESVAIVGNSGKVTAKAKGNATITCKANDGSGVYSTCAVTVDEDPVVAVINSTNFPDNNFRNCLLSTTYGEDGKITQKEVNNIISLDVSNKEIKSLKGIEFFTALKWLSCSDNQLTSLDVSKCTALTTLYCYDNQLTSLDVSKNTALKTLHCYNNQLTSLDVSKCTALTSLSCQGNQLTSLDVSKCTALTTLFCGGNQLTSLDVSKCTALTNLNCCDNQLTSLDVSKNTALTTFDCYDNQLTSLDVSKCTALTSLRCYDNQLTSLDVSKCTALTTLYCWNNQLTSLDLSKNTALKELWCNNNQLTTLDVSKNTALETLSCPSNQLTSLDVSKNTALSYLQCNRNQLTSLDVSKNTALKALYFVCNNIKGTAMDNLIKGLRRNTSDNEFGFRVVNIDEDEDEGNVCTTEQVAAVKVKGWTPQCWNGTEWVEYEGSPSVIVPTAITLPDVVTVDVGKTITLTPTLQPADAETTITWASDDTSVAKVTQSGMVLGVKEGTAIVSATTGNGLKAECFVMVQGDTGIEEIATGHGTPSAVYSPSGQRLASPRKGLNIIDGKKVVKK